MFKFNQKFIKQIFVICVVFANLLGAALIAEAQIQPPVTTITYQGRLTDGGAPANGVYDFQFQLFSAGGLATGEAVTVEDVTVTNGVFNAQFNPGAAAFQQGSFGSRTVEVRVRPGSSTDFFTALAPRQPLTAAPYAVAAINATIAETAEGATNADALGGIASSGYVQNRTTAQSADFNISGNGTIGRTLTTLNATVTGNLNVQNNITFQGSLNGSGANLTNLNAANVTGTFAAAQIPNLDAAKITTGTIDARLSSNIPRLNAANTFTSNQILNGNLSQTGTTTDLNLTNGFLARGMFGTGAIPATGAGTRMMFYPNKAAFRAGYINSSQWNDVNIGDYSTAFGYNTTAIGNYSTALGSGTEASGIISTAIGFGATASGIISTALGEGSTASGSNSTALGVNTLASGNSSTAMGYNTTASGSVSTAMGNATLASGNYSTAFGFSTTASGDFSTAIGRFASTNDMDGSFVYGDLSTTTNVTATTANQFVVRASGGFRFRTNSGLTTGCDLPAGSGVFSCTSSKSVKENFASASGRDVLRRLRSVPVNYWNYVGEQRGVRHLGAFAEDFYKAFKLGTDDKSIGLLDVAGVNMAATKALDEKTDDLQSQIEAQKSQIETQKTELAAQTAKIETQQKTIERQQKQLDALLKFICANNSAADVCRPEEK